VLSLLQSRLIASVQLIAAMGGGWDGQLQASEQK
jgi:outer membrane protein TolC